MRRLFVALVSMAGALVGSMAFAQTGTVTGTIVTKAAALRPMRVTIDQKVCGAALPDEAVVVDAAGHLANAVVTLVGVKATGAAPAPAVLNAGCRFAPRVQVVRSNASVAASSTDGVLHTTHLQTDTGKTVFNVALPAPGITLRKPVGGAGITRLSCNIHPWMRGWVAVTDDMAVVTGADGRFSLAGVPPGTYELRLWHETLKATSQRVTIAASKPVELKIELR